MSRGFGKVQKKIIKYLEKHGVSSTKEFLLSFPEHKQNSMYRAIQRMTLSKGNPSDNVLIPPGDKVLWRRENSESRMWKLNKKNQKYIEYKQKNV